MFRQIQSYDEFLKNKDECMETYNLLLCTFFIKERIKVIHEYKKMIYSIPCKPHEEGKRDVIWEWLNKDVDTPFLFYIIKRRNFYERNNRTND